ncbi:MAG: hypothetical protein HRS57_00470 [Mycoplasmataceae bacterium]|nr:hypothetical protein [Mycoplasmataceae bacterium]
MAIEKTRNIISEEKDSNGISTWVNFSNFVIFISTVIFSIVLGMSFLFRNPSMQDVSGLRDPFSGTEWELNSETDYSSLDTWSNSIDQSLDYLPGNLISTIANSIDIFIIQVKNNNETIDYLYYSLDDVVDNLNEILNEFDSYNYNNVIASDFFVWQPIKSRVIPFSTMLGIYILSLLLSMFYRKKNPATGEIYITYIDVIVGFFGGIIPAIKFYKYMNL